MGRYQLGENSNVGRFELGSRKEETSGKRASKENIRESKWEEQLGKYRVGGAGGKKI